MSESSRPPGTPRGTRARVSLSAAMVLAVWLGVGVLDDWLAAATDLSYWITSLVSLVPLAGLHAWLAPKVGYRWFDAAVLIVPFVGLAWSARVFWRVYRLPYPDWPARPDRPAHGADRLPAEIGDAAQPGR